MYNEWEKNQKNINSENDVDMTEGSYVDSTHYERTQENRQADRNRECFLRERSARQRHCFCWMSL